LRIAEHIYGSDQHGLIWGYRFAPERPVEAFDGRAHGFFFIAGTLIALTGVLIYVVFGKRRD